MNFSFLLDIFFPKRCVGCGRVGKYICFSCIKLLIPVSDNETICPVCEHAAFLGVTHPKCRGRYVPDGLTSFFRYRSVSKKLIAAIKYRLVSDMVGEFVDTVSPTSHNMLVSVIQKHQEIQLIPIPLHSSRLHSRGFNQAEILGSQLARRFGIMLDLEILKRIQKTKTQVSMKDRKARLTNMNGVFQVNSHAKVSGRSFIIFDDVFTTGATIRAATKTLKEAGASFVWAVTMAR
jgi:competence protein ComFC